MDIPGFADHGHVSQFGQSTIDPQFLTANDVSALQPQNYQGRFLDFSTSDPLPKILSGRGQGVNNNMGYGFDVSAIPQGASRICYPAKGAEEHRYPAALCNRATTTQTRFTPARSKWYILQPLSLDFSLSKPTDKSCRSIDTSKSAKGLGSQDEEEGSHRQSPSWAAKEGRLQTSHRESRLCF